MAIVRVSSADIDREELLAELVKARVRTGEEIEAEAIEDDDAWTDDDLALGILVHPPTRPERIRAVRTHLGLTQADFGPGLHVASPARR